MTLKETLEYFRQDFINIFELYLYHYNNKNERKSLVCDLSKVLHGNFIDDTIGDIIIEDISTDEIISQGSILLQFTNNKTKETLTLNFG